MGSKARIAKDILPIMLDDIGDNWFMDLFCGGGNLIQFATCKKKFASDINPYTIAFLKNLQKKGTDWLPKTVYEFSRENYMYMKSHKDAFSKAVLGHVGYNLSYGGKWFNSFRADKVGKRDYVAEAYRGACKQAELIKDVKFACCSYDKVKIPANSVVYCDIPYRGTGKYEAVGDFDHEVFYGWCRARTSEGVKVYVSEYSMPEDFKCVWQKDIRVQIKKDDNSTKATEKLFLCNLT